MATRIFAVDRKGKKFFIGSTVEYKNNLYFVEDMLFTAHPRDQYITIKQKSNQYKILEYILPKDVILKA